MFRNTRTFLLFVCIFIRDEVENPLSSPERTLPLPSVHWGMRPAGMRSRVYSPSVKMKRMASGVIITKYADNRNVVGVDKSIVFAPFELAKGF